MADITVSVVNHGHDPSLRLLLDDLSKCKFVSEIILTQNLREHEEPIVPSNLTEKLRTLKNSNPLGFAKNHNNAFRFCRSKFFLVINPDVRVGAKVLSNLTRHLSGLEAGCIAPRVIDLDGHPQANCREFPTIVSFLKRLFGINSRIEIEKFGKPISVPWASGCFLLFHSDDYRLVGGFCEKYHLYYEDVDICLRLWNAKRKVIADPASTIVHEGQYDSSKKLRFFVWHLTSLIKFFRLNGFARPKVS